MDRVSGPARGISSAFALGSGNGPVRGRGHVNGTQGRTNGLVKGIGRTNGLVNGVGRANGRVNGLGRTNGVTNGGRPRDARSARPVFRSVTRRDFRAAYGIIAGSITIMLIFSFLLGTQVPAPPPYVFAVDGNFGEWRHVPLNSDPAGAGPPQTDLLSYAVHAEPGQLFVYGKTRGPLFEGPTMSSVFVLIRDPNRTGYNAPEIDAEFVAEIWGWNGTLQGSLLRQWNGAADQDNASALQPIGSFPAIAVGDEFELALDRNEIGFDPALQVVLPPRASAALDAGAIVSLPPRHTRLAH